MEAQRLLKLAQARNHATNGSGRTIRQASGLSLREVAAALGISAATLSRWETGQNRPHGAPALNWADLLDILAGSQGHHHD